MSHACNRRSPLSWNFLGIIAALLTGAGIPSSAAVDLTHPWDPSLPLPQFITHDYVDPANIVAIAKYRSGVGHSYSDNYEPADRSLKYYFEPRKKFLNTRGVLAVSAPATGTITSVTPEQQVLSNGDIRGNQVLIAPDSFPAFEVHLFHVNLSAGLGVGSHVNAGDPLGFADLRESVDFDLAVAAAWNATQTFPSGQSTAPPGVRLLSACDLMNDATFAHFAAYGITDRSALIVPLAYRNAHPGAFGSEDLYNFDPVEYAVFLTTPDIGNQPASLVVNPGSSGFFDVLASAQGLPVTYQWYLNGAPLANGTAYSGAASQALTIFSASAAQAGTYTVTVSDTFGSTTSDPATLTVLAAPVPAPVILTQPAGQTVQGGSNVTLSVVAAGFNLSYQWIHDNAIVFGAISASLTLPAVGTAQAGTYMVTVSNPAGSVTSGPAVVNVTVVPPSITAQPSNQTYGPTSSVTFSVGTSGSGLNFQWTHDGTPLFSLGNTVVASTTSGSTLTLFNVGAAQAGSYAVTVSNTAGSVTSNAATLTAAPPSPNTGSGGGSGGGGGGAPSLWFLGALAILAGVRLGGRKPRARQAGQDGRAG